eukprot:8428406-Pyramimonas_sp.AAC.1
MWSKLRGATQAWCQRCGAMCVARSVWCIRCDALFPAGLEVVDSTARAIFPPTHAQYGLQNQCGGDCDECLALA